VLGLDAAPAQNTSNLYLHVRRLLGPNGKHKLYCPEIWDKFPWFKTI